MIRNRLSAESMVALLPRLEGYIDRSDPSGCHLWTGAQSRNGYGRFEIQYNNRSFKKIAHRLYYEIKVEVLDPNIQLDHLCRTRLCMNLSHLEPVSAQVNTLRGYGPSAKNAEKTHCIHGHEFDETNTGHSRKGTRYCRACSLISWRAWEARRRAKMVPL